jgi:hypothetical protein
MDDRRIRQREAIEIELAYSLRIHVPGVHPGLDLPLPNGGAARIEGYPAASLRAVYLNGIGRYRVRFLV